MYYEFRQDESSVPSVLEQVNFALDKARVSAFLEMFALSKTPYSIALGWHCNMCSDYNQNVEYCVNCNCQKPHTE